MAFYRSFIRGSETLETTSSSSSTEINSVKSRSLQGRPYSGQEAKSFYDDLVGLSRSGTPNNSSKVSEESKREERKSGKRESHTYEKKSSSLKRACRRKVITIQPKTERQLRRLHYDLLKYAQEGDFVEMQRCRRDGANLNFADQYGWTALMSSAFEGHSEIVKWLLENGAHTSLTNNQGQTAENLSKNRTIVRLFKNHRKGLSLDSGAAKANITEKFYCDICKKEFSDTTQVAHQTSTLHLFNRQEKPQSTHYYIPPTNKGFQLMVRGGWELNKGLGVEGQGRKYPVKTVLKRDRQGLGKGDAPPAKVTHFDPNDAMAVAAPPKPRVEKATTLTKKQRKKQISKERAKEIDFRLEFYSE